MSDPNADVPLWVNIVVPVILGAVFFAVLVVLFYTDKEIPIETLEYWVQRIPLVNRFFSEVDEENTATSKEKSNTTKQQRQCKPQHDEKTLLNPQYLLKYDSISILKAHQAQDSEGCSTKSNGIDNPNFRYSQGTCISFESNV